MRSRRMPPLLPTYAYTTFSIRTPQETHHVPATCEEVSCSAYLRGWCWNVSLLSEYDLYVATHSGRRYRWTEDENGEKYVAFEAGQRCFAKHTRRLERPELYVVGRGDHRSFDPRTARRHSGPDAWLDEFQTNLENLRNL